MQQLPAALQGLAAYRQFMTYVVVPDPKHPGKMTKRPTDPHTGHVVDPHDSAHWVTAEEACATGRPVAFVLTDDDPFWFLDIDGCLVDGSWSPLALDLCNRFAGAAVEVSQSGKGLHLIGSGPAPAHGCKNADSHLEFYTTKRFIALTGTNAIGDCRTDHAGAVAALVAEYFPPGAEHVAAIGGGPCAEWDGPEDDAELLRMALKSHSAASAFGTKASFADLWNANETVLAAAYPDADRPYDYNRADAALAQHLAFWTGKDAERIERLMRQSALYRDKWDSHATYLSGLTIPNACAMQREVYSRPQAPAADTSGPQYLPIPAQIELFKGCCYVTELHKVLVPGGMLLDSGQFRVAFGGYSFPIDHAGKRVTRNAWEAFTECQAYRYPRADRTNFWPDTEPGSLTRIEGQTYVNTWWPVEVDRTPGDVAPFLTHMAKVLPVERDRLILLSYMAACVQYPGRKFQWAPLLQGTPGNGKTLFTLCVAAAVGRRYVHWAQASDLNNKFNGWLLGKLLIGVEDIYTVEDKADIYEALKTMITGGSGIGIQLKGVDATSADICCNFMFNSNHRDALKLTRDDRRFAPFYTAQQSVDDLARDGMDEEYFANLYHWLEHGGYAAVAHYLHTWAIPVELNPAGRCVRRPETSSIAEAVVASMGSVEQEILEAVEQGLPGFCGGWISSLAVDRLLERLGVHRRIPVNRRRDILRPLGYDWHPSLRDGRVNNPVLPDAGKPRLYIKLGSGLEKLATCADISRAYSDAQTGKAAAVFGVPVPPPPVAQVGNSPSGSNG